MEDPSESNPSQYCIEKPSAMAHGWSENRGWRTPRGGGGQQAEPRAGGQEGLVHVQDDGGATGATAGVAYQGPAQHTN